MSFRSLKCDRVLTRKQAASGPPTQPFKAEAELSTVKNGRTKARVLQRHSRQERRRYSVKLYSKNWHSIPGRGEVLDTKHPRSGAHKDRKKANASLVDVAATAIGAALVVVSRADRCWRARIRVIVRRSRLVVSRFSVLRRAKLAHMTEHGPGTCVGARHVTAWP